MNAILRKIEKTDFEDFFEIENEIERISKTTSMPIWMVEKLKEEKTIKEVGEICKASNLKPKLYVRRNTLKIAQEELKEELEREGIKIQEAEVKDFFRLEGAKNIEAKKSFQEGKYTIQDEAAGFIPQILNPQANEKVLDACSSPGGKTTYMAELMGNQGEIIAWDLHQHRIELVERTAKRLGITIIRTEIKDATIYEAKYEEKFDKILLDVPCLGMGVLKRKPDIKWKRKKEDLEKIVQEQEKILENCAKYLKKGGELVYSTCSIIKEENENQIDHFLQKNKNFEIKKIEKKEESYFEKFITQEGFIKIYQNENTDGFFMAKLRKK